MGIFEQLGLADNDQAFIDWDITPAKTFTIFESWGSKERSIRNKSERYYYFFIDSWQQPAKVCLMERGIKHAVVLAEIDAPDDKIERCIKSQGAKAGLDKCYAVDDDLRAWLTVNVLDKGSSSKVVRPLTAIVETEDMDAGLPGLGEELEAYIRVDLPDQGGDISEDELGALAEKYNFFDTKYNSKGKFENCLVDNGDGLTVTDMATGIMWQREGGDICSIRKTQAYLAEMNKKMFGGHGDWRLPTMEEAWSLFEPQLNDKGLYLSKCFSKKQPFVFLAGQRQPGGYWFADFKQGTVFWASGTIPGGFGRLCRTA